MEGRLGRSRGILGALFPKYYFFKLDAVTAKLSYAQTKDSIDQPLKEIDLTDASVQKRSDKIHITTSDGESFKLKAQSDSEASIWHSKIDNAIKEERSRTRRPDGEDQSQEIDEVKEGSNSNDDSMLYADDNDTVQKHGEEEGIKKRDKRTPAGATGRKGIVSMEKCQWIKDDENPQISPSQKDETYVHLHEEFKRHADSSSKWMPVSEQKRKQYVVAIDFGTTYSGYAFQDFKEHSRTPASGNTEKWKGNNVISDKAPTGLLLDKDGEFKAFGYDAETMYFDLIDEGKEKGWKFFKQFKMKIYQNKELSCDIEINDDQGNPMPAIIVFGLSLEYMKRRALKKIEESEPIIMEENVFFVITVPAIWSDGCRQFMIKAIGVAGMDMDQAILAKEPEAAAIYCKEKQLEVQQANKVFQGTVKRFKFEKGSKFIVLDFGGGTTDVALHEVIDNGRMKLLHSASGGPWGGTNPNAEFISLIIEIMGKDNFDEIVQHDRAGYYSLSQNWEVNKRRDVLEGENSSNIKIILPHDFKAAKGNGEYKTSKGNVNVHKGTLSIPYKTFKSLFDTTVFQIVNHLKEMSKHGAFDNITMMFMVGGFSDNRFVQEAVKEAFSDMKIIVPKEPDLAVLHGAVAYGFQPDSIDARVSPCYYGIEENGIFITLINKGQEIPIGAIVSSYRTKLVYKDNGFHVKIYASDERFPPKEIQKCKKLGNITIRMARVTVKLEREIKISIYFDHTEMKLKATDVATGREFHTTCDFLEDAYTQL